MKKTLSIFSLLFVAGLSYAQTNLSTDENYIYTKNCLNEDCTRKTEAVQYSDGLGRAKQIIAIKATPLGKDIVTPSEYDVFGRQVKSYLPIPQTGTQNGMIYSDPKANSAQSYGADLNFYSYTQLENSPSAKVLSTTKPGADFQNHPVSYGYTVNTATDVKKYTVITTWVNEATENTLSLSGNYPAGQLLKTSVTDEDGNTSTELTNGKGETLLVRKAAGNGQNSDTYYVYNKYGQLSYVIPPLASAEPMNQTTLNNLCYQYRYDSKGRQVEKKLPGKGWEYMVYDKSGRLLMSQDANLGKTNQWMVSKYDQYGRTVYSGIYTGSQNYGSAGRAAEQNNANAATVQNEIKSTGGFSAHGLTAYYTDSTYPTALSTILAISYYDTYPADSPARPSQVMGKATIGDQMGNTVNTKNLPTASFVKNLDGDNWTKTYIWYDEKARAVGTQTINHMGGYTKTESSLDFAGVPQQTKIYHKRLSADTEKIITQTFTYDSQNRLLRQYHEVNGLQQQELLSENTYNELSQLSNKKVGNNLQSIDYTYNITGRLTKLNDPANQGTKLFAYELKYYNPASTAIGKRTGNIAEATWKTASDQVLRKYNYQYDALNRMTAGLYSEPSSTAPENDFYNESAVYDLGGNITALQRSGKNSLGLKAGIDNLTYSYTGNKLNSVTDTSNDYAGYPDTSGAIITYDDNGNMTSHVDKGILDIQYNMLNLPGYVQFNDFVDRKGKRQYVSTSYSYRADGTKIRKMYAYKTWVNSASAIINTTVTDYLDGFQYETEGANDPVLKFVPTAEGYFNFENNKYIYNYTDHLGNVRLSYTKNGLGTEIIEENNYYPYGLKHEGYNLTAGNPAYNYGYNGKELQKETGWQDYGARMYMADIARWGVIDPLAETTTRINPYNYALDNPISFIDPDGRKSQHWGPEHDLFGLENESVINRSLYNNRFASFTSFLGNDMPFAEGQSNAGGGGDDRTPKGNGDPNSNIFKTIGKWLSGIFRSKKKEGKLDVGTLERIPLEEEKPDMTMALVLNLILGSSDPFMSIGNSGIGPYAEERENIGAVAMIFINPEVGSEKLLLKTATNGGRRTLVNLTEETFSQALLKGAENVGGYSIYGTKGLVGNTFNRNIFLLETSGTKSLSGFRSLIGSMESEALLTGANKISIYGSSVINKGFLNPNIAKRFGYTFEQSGSGVILQKTFKP